MIAGDTIPPLAFWITVPVFLIGLGILSFGLVQKFPVLAARAPAPTAAEQPPPGGPVIRRVIEKAESLQPIARFCIDGLGLGKQQGGGRELVLDTAAVPHAVELLDAELRPAGDTHGPGKFLVLYIPDREAWEDAVRRLMDLGFEPVEPANETWDRDGATFADPEGFHVVLQNAAREP